MKKSEVNTEPFAVTKKVDGGYQGIVFDPKTKKETVVGIYRDEKTAGEMANQMITDKKSSKAWDSSKKETSIEKPSTTDVKSDIEKRRREELNNARTDSRFETREEEDAFQNEASDRRSDIKDREKEISEAKSKQEIADINKKYDKKDALRTKRISSPFESEEGKVIVKAERDKINAKYDAEIKDLESKVAEKTTTPKKETPSPKTAIQISAEQDMLDEEDAVEASDKEDIATVKKMNDDAEIIKGFSKENYKDKSTAELKDLVEKKYIGTLERAYKAKIDGKISKPTYTEYRNKLNDIISGKLAEYSEKKVKGGGQEGESLRKGELKAQVSALGEKVKEKLLGQGFKNVALSSAVPITPKMIEDLVNLTVKGVHLGIDLGYGVREATARAITAIKAHPKYQQVINSGMSEKDFTKSVNAEFSKAKSTYVPPVVVEEVVVEKKTSDGEEITASEVEASLSELEKTNPDAIQDIRKKVNIFSEETKSKTELFIDDPKTEVQSAVKFLEDEKFNNADILNIIKPFIKNVKVYSQDDYDFVLNDFEYGATITSSGDILIFKKGNYTSSTVVHEALHLMLFEKLNKTSRSNPDQELIDEIQRIFDASKDKLSKKHEYAYTNLDEFVSELFSDNTLMDDLSKIKDPKSNDKNSLFDLLLNSIKNLFKNGYGKKISDSLLNSALKSVVKSIKTPISSTKEMASTYETFKKNKENTEYTNAIDDIVKERRLKNSVSEKTTTEKPVESTTSEKTTESTGSAPEPEAETTEKKGASEPKKQMTSSEFETGETAKRKVTERLEGSEKYNNILASMKEDDKSYNVMKLSEIYDAVKKKINEFERAGKLSELAIDLLDPKRTDAFPPEAIPELLTQLADRFNSIADEESNEFVKQELYNLAAELMTSQGKLGTTTGKTLAAMRLAAERMPTSKAGLKSFVNKQMNNVADASMSEKNKEEIDAAVKELVDLQVKEKLSEIAEGTKGKDQVAKIKTELSSLKIDLKDC